MNRVEIGELIAERLRPAVERLRTDFRLEGRVHSAFIDDLLPAELAKSIFDRFPEKGRMKFRRSIKENKYVAAQMDECDSLIEEAVYAFQEPRVVELVGEITGLKALEPDSDLYAGGISVMTKGGYLRPHLDNSHDKDQARYRVLNLLYYVSPGWEETWGGSLQLWDRGPHTTPRTIHAQFNRLVFMVTNRTSWHSVNAISADGRRCCVSNYYFSKVPPEEQDYFHATSFRDEGTGISDAIMQADNAVRTAILKNLPGVYKNPHVYKRKD